MRLHKLKKTLWTPNKKQNIGMIDNFLFHQVKAKRVPNTVTAAYSNLRPVANEISSVQPYSDSCMNISFLRLPSHIPVVHVLPIMLSSVKFTLKKKSKDEGLSYPC